MTLMGERLIRSGGPSIQSLLVDVDIWCKDGGLVLSKGLQLGACYEYIISKITYVERTGIP